MKTAFDIQEYRTRLRNVRARMNSRGIEMLFVTDPANINYLTGYDGWSFYVPQAAIVTLDDMDPFWIGRQMDVAQGPLTSWLPTSHLVGYPESFVQMTDRHPMDWIADWISGRGWQSKTIGLETDSYYFSPKACDRLKACLPNAKFSDADLLVNWVRSIKSEREISYMRKAAGLVAKVMETAFNSVEPGVRQCDAMATIIATQIGGAEDFSGDLTALCPLVMSGEAACAPHPIWSAERFKNNQTTALELGATCHRYHAALARTLHWGTPPARLVTTSDVVNEGLEAALNAIKAGNLAENVELAWRKVLERHGMTKASRIGYSIGLGYPPDWGEHTISLRPGDKTILQPNMTVHLMLGMWLDGWGMEMSETVLVGNNSAECLTSFPRTLHVRS